MSGDTSAAEIRPMSLADGTPVQLRPMGPADAEAVRSLWGRLSARTIEQRFFTQQTLDDDALHHLVAMDGRDRFALAAWAGGDIIGVARFDRLPEDPTTAEFAVTVQDDVQGRGIGTGLLRALVDAAKTRGVRRLHGDVLPGNDAMRRLVAAAGYTSTERDYGSSIAVSFNLG